MEEKELKTSTKQRVVIILIAVIMLGSIIASYAAIVINGSKAKGDTESKVDEAKMVQYEEEYTEKQSELSTAAQKDYDTFIKYKGEVKAYNEAAANEGDVQTRDLVKGSGNKLAEGDTNYLAYYIGWCADETVFDSTFDNNDNPTGFAKILNPAAGMIQGWNEGVVGMRLGGIREITIPGELAYGESTEICGGKNKPLKFMVMAVANEEPLKTIAEELELAQMKLQYAYYGLDYDEVMQQQ